MRARRRRAADRAWPLLPRRVRAREQRDRIHDRTHGLSPPAKLVARLGARKLERTDAEHMFREHARERAADPGNLALARRVVNDGKASFAAARSSLQLTALAALGACAPHGRTRAIHSPSRGPLPSVAATPWMRRSRAQRSSRLGPTPSSPASPWSRAAISRRASRRTALRAPPTTALRTARQRERARVALRALRARRRSSARVLFRRRQAADGQARSSASMRRRVLAPAPARATLSRGSADAPTEGFEELARHLLGAAEQPARLAFERERGRGNSVGPLDADAHARRAAQQAA